jgi:hypothetical protein
MPRTGPLVVVLASAPPEAADAHAVGEASLNNAWITECLGLGYALPDPYAPDGLWLHVYATERPTSLEVAVDAVRLAVGDSKPTQDHDQEN